MSENNLITQDISKLNQTQLLQLYTKLHLPPSAASTSLSNYLNQCSSSSSASQAQLTKPLVLQIVDIENTTKSKINQIDELLGLINPNDSRSDQLKNSKVGAKGKKTQQNGNARGANGDNSGNRNRIIRDVDINSEDTNMINTNSYGSDKNYYKLTLMDHKSTSVYAIELSKLQFLGAGPDAAMALPINFLGAKLVVHPGTRVLYGVLLLKNELTTLVNGTMNSAGSQSTSEHSMLMMNRVIMERLQKKLHRSGEINSE